MSIRVKRAYEDASADDGYRVLVDRLWPRGVSKERLEADDWLKDVAPSDDLRHWFGHDPDRWDEFRSRYARELEDHQELVAELLERARAGDLTLLYAAKDEAHNNAIALRAYLDDRLAKE